MKPNLSEAPCVLPCMNDCDHLRYHNAALARAAELLGEPVRAVSLTTGAEQLLLKHLRLEPRFGLTGPLPHLTINGGPRGQRLEYGVERYRAVIDGQVVALARVLAPEAGDSAWSCYEFWAVPTDHYRRLYRYLRRLERNTLATAPPVMHEADRLLLWNNMIRAVAC
ncbi:MAG: hypothetical protein ACKV0T_13995 [Planctomycetales bacterium]